jgi:hypothetical protein
LEDEAEVFAPNFAGFLYRRLLEEFSGTWLTEMLSLKDVQALFVRYSEELTDVLQAEWVSVLRDLVRRELRERADGAVGLLTREDANAIVAGAGAEWNAGRALGRFRQPDAGGGQ